VRRQDPVSDAIIRGCCIVAAAVGNAVAAAVRGEKPWTAEGVLDEADCLYHAEMTRAPVNYPEDASEVAPPSVEEAERFLESVRKRAAAQRAMRKEEKEAMAVAIAEEEDVKQTRHENPA